LTQEQSSQLITLLKNVQLNQERHNVGSPYQGPNHNSGSTNFTSFRCVNTSDYIQDLYLLSSVDNWHDTWIIDTGASDHMCHNRGLFTNLMALIKPSTVILANGQRVTVTHAKLL